MQPRELTGPACLFGVATAAPAAGAAEFTKWLNGRLEPLALCESSREDVLAGITTFLHPSNTHKARPGGAARARLELRFGRPATSASALTQPLTRAWHRIASRTPAAGVQGVSKT